MKGLAVTIFIENGNVELIGDCRVLAPENGREFVAAMTAIGKCVDAKLTEREGWSNQDIGIYCELFDIHPALEPMYRFNASCQGQGIEAQLAMAWKEVTSRKGMGTNGSR